MNLYTFNYYVPDKGVKEICVLSNYENTALHKVLKIGIDKENGCLSLKKCKPIYDF